MPKGPTSRPSNRFIKSLVSSRDPHNRKMGRSFSKQLRAARKIGRITDTITASKIATRKKR
jgi:hypothetical protein